MGSGELNCIIFSCNDVFLHTIGTSRSSVIMFTIASIRSNTGTPILTKRTTICCKKDILVNLSAMLCILTKRLVYWRISIRSLNINYIFASSRWCSRLERSPCMQTNVCSNPSRDRRKKVTAVKSSATGLSVTGPH